MTLVARPHLEAVEFALVTVRHDVGEVDFAHACVLDVKSRKRSRLIISVNVNLVLAKRKIIFHKHTIGVRG